MEFGFSDIARAGLVLGTVAGIVALSVAIPVANAFGRRRSLTVDDETEENEENYMDWQQINHLAQTVISGIQNGYLKYQV